MRGHPVERPEVSGSHLSWVLLNPSVLLPYRAGTDG